MTEPAMRFRSELMDALRERIAHQHWDDCIDLCFRLLFRLPSNVQVEVARSMASRYLPIVEAHFPDAAWPRQLLDNPQEWVETTGRGVPDDPVLTLPSDAAFLFAIDGLLLACSNQRDDLVLTSSCAFAIGKSIHALADNVWIADDPIGLALWQRIASAVESGPRFGDTLREFARHDPQKNVPALAVRQREWTHLIEVLRNNRISDYPEATDPAEREAGLQRWQERERVLLTALP